MKWDSIHFHSKDKNIISGVFYVVRSCSGLEERGFLPTYWLVSEFVPKKPFLCIFFSCTVSRESMTAIAMVAVWALTGMSQWAFVPTNHCINTHKKVQLVFRGRGGTCLRGVRWWVDHIAVASAMLGRAKNNRLQKQFLLISQSAGKLPKNGAFFARRCGENGGKPSLWSLLVANVCFTTHVESWNSSLLIKSQN